jgi:uncharacterized membrane protein
MMTEPDNHNLEAPARRDEHEGEGATRGTARMEAFADGVFAIAFTLPIVNIAMPSLFHPGASLARDLADLVPSFAGYGLASVVIGLYWVQHHFSGAIYRTTGHWFLLATVLFLTMIGFIAYPARVLTEHFHDPAARAAAAQFMVASMAATSWAWLLKWSVGYWRGQVDARLDPAYVGRINRGYWQLAMANLAATALVFWNWQSGLAVSTLAFLVLLRPPETPRYLTEAPIVEGEG